VKLTLVCGNLLVGSTRNFLYVADIELFKVPTKMFHKGKTYNLLLFHLYKSSFLLMFNLSLNDFYFRRNSDNIVISRYYNNRYYTLMLHDK
jgi:hypothetical protein